MTGRSSAAKDRLLFCGPGADQLRQDSFLGLRLTEQAPIPFQPPTSLLMMLPNRSQVSPLNLASCSCEIGAKLVAEVLILMPGKRPSSSRSLMPAACFIT